MLERSVCKSASKSLAKTRRSWRCVINLGDLYDGYNDDDPEHLYFRDQSKWPEEIKERNSKEFEEMVEIIKDEFVEGSATGFRARNHDMAVTREVFKAKMNIKEDYYKVELPRNWVLLCLDTTDMNPRYVEENSEAWKEGQAWLCVQD